MSVFLSSFPRPISMLTPFDVEQGAQHTPAGCGSQDCSHASSSIWINWPTMNKSHVIKEYMHKIGVRNACHVTEAVQSWGFVPPQAGDQLLTLPLDCIRDLPPPDSLTLHFNLRGYTMRSFVPSCATSLALLIMYGIRHDGATCGGGEILRG